MAKVLGIGNCVLDIILSTDHYPTEDSEMRVSKRNFSTGGNVANSLSVLSQLSHETAICCTLAEDENAKILRRSLQQKRISTEFIQSFIKGETPSSYITLNEANGSRSILHYRDLAETSFDHFAKIEIEDFDWLHFEARNMDNLPGMLNIAKTFLTTQPISLEVEKNRPGIETLIPLANVVFFSKAYALANQFDSAHDLLESMKKTAPQSTLICSWGEQGAWFCGPNGEVKHQAATLVPQVVDTLGAGDTFNAGVIHSLLHADKLEDAIKAGTQLAARKCQQYGFEHLLKPIQKQQPLANIKQVTNAKTLVVNTPDYPKEVVLIKHEEEVKAYENNCPHQDVPLNEAYKIDVNPFDKTLKCSVHEAFFNIEDGECVEGPCQNDYLTEVPIRINEQGNIFIQKS